jgi:hypothetical protein
LQKIQKINNLIVQQITRQMGIILRSRQIPQIRTEAKGSKGSI